MADEQKYDPAIDDDEGSLSSAFTDAMSSGESTSDVSVSDEAVTPDKVTDTVSVTDEQVDEAIDSSSEASAGLDDELIAEARAAGLDPSQYTSEAELARATMRHLREMQPLVSYAKTMTPYADEIRDFLNKRGEAPKADVKADSKTDEFDAGKYFQDQYGGPTWKPEFDRIISAGQVRIDDTTGAWAAAPGHEALVGSLVLEMNNVQGHTNAFWRDIAKGNPYERFFGVMKEPLLREVERRVQDALSGQQERTAKESYVQSFERENSTWLYSIDPQTGQQVLSDRGQEFIKASNEARDEFGIEDASARIKYAQRVLGVGQQSAPQTPTKAADQAVVPEKQESKSFLDTAKRRAEHGGASASVRQNSEAVPQVVTENDLDSMFISAQRQVMGA